MDQCEKERPRKCGQKDLYPALIDMQVKALPGCGEIGNSNLYLYPCVVSVLNMELLLKMTGMDWLDIIIAELAFLWWLCWLPVGFQAQFNALESNGNKDGIV